MNPVAKILMADDHLIFRDSLLFVLKEHNIVSLGEAANGLELLSLVKKHTPDVILLDIKMPVMDGNETLDILNREYPFLKVIILTQFSGRELAKNYLKRGARAFVTKSAPVETLVSAITSVKENGYYCSNILNIVEKPNSIRPKKEIFSLREMEIMLLILKNHTSMQIAGSLLISVKAVEAHRKDIYGKANVRSLAEFINYACDNGFNYLKARL